MDFDIVKSLEKEVEWRDQVMKKVMWTEKIADIGNFYDNVRCGDLLFCCCYICIPYLLE